MIVRKLSFGGSAVALVLVSVAVILYSTRAKAEETKPSTTEVRVDNFSFGAETLTVRTNTTVTWVNKDDVPHVIASNDGVFKSKALDTDEQYSYTFTKAGTYSYYCSIHPKMVGKIVVQ